MYYNRKWLYKHNFFKLFSLKTCPTAVESPHSLVLFLFLVLVLVHGAPLLLPLDGLFQPLVPLVPVRGRALLVAPAVRIGLVVRRGAGRGLLRRVRRVPGHVYA